jgi:DNA-directed RNA polymerase delta subunit
MENYKLKDNKTNKTSQKPEGFLALAEKILEELNDRSRDIIRQRFGLLSGKSETLEKIGARYGITRERVRQIIAEALKNISKKTEGVHFSAAEEKIIFTIRRNYGIIKESEIIVALSENDLREANAIKFFSLSSKKVAIVEEKDVLEKSWTETKEILEKAKATIGEALKILGAEKKALSGNELVGKIAQNLAEISREEILSHLKTSAAIKKNKFDKWGIIHWMEINPKGTREKIYLILKETGKPLHFTQIAELIDKHGLSKRKAHPQTVHNELIKDERFVLIGRGTYALGEWGYSAGTIRQVLQDILEKKRKPLAKEEIMREVLKAR